MHTKLMNIQNELKAPKGQFNDFGNFKYRSCEDILEAVKPLLKENACVLTISDSVELIGDRFYVKATATLRDTETTSEVSVTAYAREAGTKKGQDESQITGAASSYARKYALNGLFCIDDTKDADTNEYRERQEKPQRSAPKMTKDELMDKVVALCDAKRMKVSDVCKMAKVSELAEMDESRLEACIEWIMKR